MSTANLNIYAFCDPATSKSAKADFTAVAIIGLAKGNNYVVLDVVGDRMNLYERADCVWQLHNRWRPKIWFYERYGMQADRQHIEYTKHERNDRSLRLEEVGGSTPKEDRIRRLLPVFESGRITFPPNRMRTLHDGKTVDLIDAFFQEELLAFPVGQHDDLLDAIARVLDPHIKRFPESGYEQAQRASQRQLNYLYDNGGAPMSHVERQRAKMTGRRSGGYRQSAGATPRTRRLGKTWLEMMPRIVMRIITTRSNRRRALILRTISGLRCYAGNR